MKSMRLGSGDVAALMTGLQTKSQANLMRKFVSDEIQFYNAKGSPIDAFRAGAILEERYGLILPDDYYPQVRKKSAEMDVFSCSLDFAKIENSKIVDFEELKTCNFMDLLDIEPYRENNSEGVEYVKKRYKKYYNQIQEQLYCTELESATMVFLAVYSYEDEENYTRKIKVNEYIKFRIARDENVINAIKERGKLYQRIKDYFTIPEEKKSKQLKPEANKPPQVKPEEQLQEQAETNTITPEKADEVVKELKIEPKKIIIKEIDF
ncbi:MAG: hypothetical protein HQ522_16225 [Bacteroidetes bacterium]|nr:hypothetical protein [Bacteroidota bacterium]